MPTAAMSSCHMQLPSDSHSSLRVQGAVEVWEYSQRQINLFRESQEDGARAVKFRHVPFSWFPVVRPRLSSMLIVALLRCSSYHEAPAHMMKQDGARPYDCTKCSSAITGAAPGRSSHEL